MVHRPQIHHLRLNRDIKRRDQLVGDQTIGLQCRGPDNADALALAAAELARTATCGAARQMHRIH
jgi:hypothetical protein